MSVFFDELITSKQNKHVKEAASLLSVKGRREAFLTRFDGVKLFLEAVSCGVRIEKILLSSSKKEAILERIRSSGVEITPEICGSVFTLSDSVFSSLTEEKAPEGIISIVKYLDKSEKSGTILRKGFEKSRENGQSLPEEVPVFALESIRDPGNLGTIIRTLLAFGIRRIYISSDCADVLSPKVIRSSMGAVFAAELLQAESLPDVLCTLKDEGFRINAAALYGEPMLLSEAELCERDIFVVGNEGHGLSERTLAEADRAVIIDMQAGPGCESLNASVAAAICAWELKKRIN